MQEHDNTFGQKCKGNFCKLMPYVINYFAGVGIGLLLSVICNIPLRFIKIINIDVGLFLVGIIGMGITLFRRSYRKGYTANPSTYSFKLKTTLLFIVMIFALQSLLNLIIGHTVYTSGPTCWLSNYILSVLNPTMKNAKKMLLGIDWLLVLIADIFIYAPLMILGEYKGSMQHNKDFSN